MVLHGYLSKREVPILCKKPSLKAKYCSKLITDEDKKLLRENTATLFRISFYASSVITVEEADKTAGNLVVSTKNPYLKASEWDGVIRWIKNFIT